MNKKKTILIAEDEKQIAKYIVNAFKRLDFNIIESRDGDETIKKAIDHNPDVILLDILMPKIDGVGVIKKLRSEGSPCEKTPIVVLSALDKLHQKRAAMDAGANEYLCKPMFTEDITNEVMKWL